MTKLIDETGKRYGRLTVIERGENGRSGRVQWLCKCDCGNDAVVLGNQLRQGDTRSCGCLQREAVAAVGRANALPLGEASLNSLIYTMQRSAKKRGLAWNLTKEQVRDLTQRRCHYCRIEPRQVTRDETHNGQYVYNGLDRVDNDRGYIVDNIVVCCGVCNRAKKDMTTGEFQACVCRVYAHFGKQREKL